MKGQTISHYQITEKIGEGAMGEVYLARDLRLNREVALKFLPEVLVNEAHRLARFEREAQLLASLNHANIAAIHAVEEHDGKPFLVMELVEGETLADQLLNGRMPIDDALKTALQISEALKAAHKKGIIHRDLKPANIKITPDGLVKVLDFGLAKQFQNAAGGIDSEAPTLHAMTIPGGVIGTPLYMSPEQALGEHVDLRADIFSFGAILYEMLTGKRAFPGATLAAIMQAVVARKPSPPRRLRPEVPVELDDLVMRSLQKERELRQQNADELCSQLKQTIENLGPRSSMVAALPVLALRNVSWNLRMWRQEHKKAAWAVSGLLLLAIVGTLGAFVLKSRGFAISSGGLTRTSAAASPYDLFQQGMTHLARYDKDENVEAASQAFQAALAKDHNYSPAYAGLGQLYLRKYQANRDKQLLETALQNAKQAVDLDRHLAVNRVSLGRVYVEKGDYDLADRELKQAVMLDQLNADAYRGLGDLERARKNWAAAEKYYTKAIELNPRDWDLRFALGNFYLRASRYSEAETAFGEAIRLAPDCFLGYRNLGAVYSMQGRFADATAQFQKSLQIKPSASTYTNLGTSLFSQGLYQQSVIAMEKARELGANNYQMWANLADAYRWTPGNESKAKEAYQTAIQLANSELSSKPDDAELRSRLALYLAKNGEKQKALADAGVIEKSDRSASVLARLVSIYEISGQRQQALDALASAVKAGYAMEEFRRDPELLELRKDPGFLKILTAVSEKPQHQN